MVMDRAQLNDMLRHKLNPFERFTDLLSGKDDRQDIMILLLYELLVVVSGGETGGDDGGLPGFPSGLQINVPLDVDTVDLIKKNEGRTTAVINSTNLADCRKALRMVIYIRNNFDQNVSVDIVGNNADTPASGTFVIATIAIAAGASGSYGINTGEWHPYIGVDVTPAGNPTTGDVNASLIRQKQEIL